MKLSAAGFWRIAAQIAVLGTLLPMAWIGYPPGHDFSVHSTQSMQFAAQIQAGEWYPRWVHAANLGAGSLAFYFYGPISYYAAATFALLGANDTTALALSTGLGAGIAYFFAILWLRRWTSPHAYAAHIGAAFYVAAPYHAVSILYNSARYAEYWAFAWLPAIFWAADRCFEERRFGIATLAVSYSALVLTHVPTALLFSPILVGYCLWRGWKSWPFLVRAGGSLVLGLGLASIFLLPALSHQVYYPWEIHRNGFYDYRNWLMFWSWSKPWAELLDRWNWITAFAAVAGLSWLVPVFAVRSLAPNDNPQTNPSKRLLAFLGVAVVLVLVMMSGLSKPIWDRVPPLQAVQFAVRWNTGLCLLLGGMVAMGVAHGSPWRTNWKSVWAIPVCFVAVNLLVSYLGIGVWIKTRWADIQRTSTIGQTLNAELAIRHDPYLFPRWATSLWLASDVANMTAVVNRTKKSWPQGATVRMESGGPYRQRWIIDGAAGKLVDLPLFYHPAWRPQAASDGASIPFVATQPDGMVRIQPRSDHEVIYFQLAKTQSERIGGWVSSLSLLVLLLLLFLERAGGRFAFR